MKPLFLRLLLVDSVFGCALVGARFAYHRHIHPVGLAAIVAVLILFTAGAVVLAVQAFHGKAKKHLLDDVAELVDALPAAAMLGTVGGFLIALSAASGDIQHRAAGAATALVSTFVGIAAMLVLRLQHRMVSRDLR